VAGRRGAGRGAGRRAPGPRVPRGYALHAPNGPDLDPPALASLAALYRDLGCRCLVVHQPVYDRHHDALLRLEPGLRPAVENHDLSPEGFAAWAEQNPGLALDVEHLWKFTLGDGPLRDLLGELRRFLGRFGGKLRHVHLPGYWPGFDEHRPMYCARGMVFPVLSLLAEAGFEGLVVLVEGAGPVQVGEGCRQPARERRRVRSAVEAVDERLAVLVVPEADAASGRPSCTACPRLATVAVGNTVAVVVSPRSWLTCTLSG
jgi:hypothetical protein